MAIVFLLQVLSTVFCAKFVFIFKKSTSDNLKAFPSKLIQKWNKWLHINVLMKCTVAFWKISRLLDIDGKR